MKDLWIDENNDFNMNGFDLQFTPDDVNYVIQRLQIKLRTFYGEYFLDTSMGLPYLPSTAPNGVSVFMKNPNMNSVSALFKAQITSEPLIDKITSFLMNYDNQARQLEVNFIAKLKSGAIVNTSILAP